MVLSPMLWSGIDIKRESDASQFLLTLPWIQTLPCQVCCVEPWPSPHLLMPVPSPLPTPPPRASQAPTPHGMPSPPNSPPFHSLLQVPLARHSVCLAPSRDVQNRSPQEGRNSNAWLQPQQLGSRQPTIADVTAQHTICAGELTTDYSGEHENLLCMHQLGRHSQYNVVVTVYP